MTPDISHLPLLLPLTDAFAQLGLGRSIGYKYIQSGELASVRIGGRRLVQREALLAFIEAHASPAEAPK